MKICIVSHEFEPFPGGGIATYHNAAARALAAAGHTVHFVTNATVFGSEDPAHKKPVHKKGNLIVHRLPLFDEDRKILPGATMLGEDLWRGADRTSAWAAHASNIAALQVADYVRELHRKVRLDVVECPEYFAEAYYIIRARRSGRAREFPPVCVHAHTSSRTAFRTNGHFWDLGYFPHRQLMAREEYCLRHADGLLSPSRSLLQRYEAEHGDALPEQRAVVPYFFEAPAAGVDAELPPELRDGGPFLLCVGRIEPRKGADLAVEAFAELSRRHPSLRLVFLGREVWHPGERFEDVMRAALGQDAMARVLRLGNVPREQVMSTMARAAAFLHPAPWDNYPCATLEAMGAGALCVVSDSGGQSEMVVDGVSGRWHRAGDAAHLVEVVDEVLQQPDGGAKMREAARERAAAVTDTSAVLAARGELFEGVAGAGGAAKRRRKPQGLPGGGVVVIDAAGLAAPAFAATRAAVERDLSGRAAYRVSVLVDAEAELDVPDGWDCFTVEQPPAWLAAPDDALLVWMTAGVVLAEGRLAECLALAQSSPDTRGAFPWLVSDEAGAFPFSPDFAARDLLVEGHVLPPAFVVRASALRSCRSLQGLPGAKVRLASLLGAAGADGDAWLRHTAEVAGRFVGELPVMDEDLQCRAAGFLDAAGGLEASATLFGGAGARRAGSTQSRRTSPQWSPPADAGSHPKGREREPCVAWVTSVEAVDQLDAPEGARVGVAVDADNWFHLVEILRACGRAGYSSELALSVEDGGLAGAPNVDVAAVYHYLRDQWRRFTGEERPEGLVGDAHGELVRQLRDLLRWQAEQALQAQGGEEVALSYPGLDHELLADDVAAMQLWSKFLAAGESQSLLRYVEGLLEHPSIQEHVAERASVRVLLLHRLWHGWDPRIHALLQRAYRPKQVREQRLAREVEVCEAAGMSWWIESTRAALGVEKAWGRRRPFRPLSAKQRDAADAERGDAPDVTVLVPSYKHGKFIAETLDSALSQSKGALRVLVADDRSPDDTVAVANSVDDERLTVCENDENLGLGNSVLQALHSVETPYVALLNSDDVFHPDRLRVCTEVLAQDGDVDLVCTGMELIDREGRSIDADSVSAWHDGRNVYDWVRWYEATKPTADEPGSLFRKLLRRNFLITSSNIVCRTDWLRAQAATLSGLKYCLDWQLFLTAALAGRLRYLPEPLLAYRLHPSNTVWFDRSSRWRYTLEVNRVAAAAVRDHLEQYSSSSQDGVSEALRDVVDALRANTEVDWLGLLVNGVIGGERLEDYVAVGGERVDYLESLPEHAAAADAGRRAAEERALAHAAKAQLLNDEVNSLISRLDWQEGRGDQLAQELREVRARVTELTSKAQELGKQVADRDAKLSDRDAKLADRDAKLADRDAKLADREAELRAIRSRLDAVEQKPDTKVQAHAREVTRLDAVIEAWEQEYAARRAELEELGAAHQATVASLAARREELREARARLQELRASRQRLREELGVVGAQLQATTRLYEQGRRRFERAGKEGADVLAAITRQVAAEQADDRRVDSDSWDLRGYRVRPGSTTRGVQRRLRKLGRKLRALFRRPRRAVAVRMVEDLLWSDRAGAVELFGDEGATELCFVDANLPTPTAGGVQVELFFPERGERQLRALAAARSLDADLLLRELRAVAVAAGVAAEQTVGLVAQAGVSLQRRGCQRLSLVGSAHWCAALAVAAELAGCQWSAVIERAAAVGGDAGELIARRLAAGANVVARSQAVAASLGAVESVYPSPLSGACQGPGDADCMLVTGRFTDAAPWAALAIGFASVAGELPGLKLRILAELDEGDPSSVSAHLVMVEFARRWPGRVVLDVIRSPSDWRAATESLRPGGLLWLGGREDCVDAPLPVVLSAMAQGVPLIATESAASRDLLGALGGAVCLEAGAGPAELAGALEQLRSARDGAAYRAELVRGRYGELAEASAAAAARLQRLGR